MKELMNSVKKQKKSTDQPTALAKWYRDKKPFLRFALWFGLLMGLFYLFTLTMLYDKYIAAIYLNLNARAAGWVIGLFGFDVRVLENNLIGPGFSLNIKRGCDASGPIALFVAGVLAFIGSWRSKIIGIILGVTLLIILNFVRIITLFFIQHYLPDLFHFIHVDVWQALFVFISLILWIVWMEWATRPSTRSKS